jgi:bacteriorhodopsin
MSVSSLSEMGAARYLDWFITTPLMLITTIIYYKYEEYLENNIEERVDFWEFLKIHRDNIIIIIICNFLMLFFGYLGELGLLDLKLSISLGFLFYGITFYIIYANYAVKSKKATRSYYYVLIVWGLYGIAAMMSPYTKNNMYNILDIFAKNFFGLYLYYCITQIVK